MTEVSVRDLRNRGGHVLDSVARGETVTVTRQGRPIAELRPVGRHGTPASELVERWRTIPTVDVQALRADLDAHVDPDL
jgi:prevent-host-death family protein